jgi:thioredoxin 1
LESQSANKLAMYLPHFESISPAEANEKIVLAGKNAVVKLYSAINGASQLLSYALAEFAPRYQEKVSFYHIDLDANPSISEEYHVKLLPAILFFKEGKLVDVLAGLTPRTIIASKINKLFTDNN